MSRAIECALMSSEYLCRRVGACCGFCAILPVAILCCIADLVYLEPFLTLVPCNLSSMDLATDGYEQLL